MLIAIVYENVERIRLAKDKD